jgi:hypothetical protein
MPSGPDVAPDGRGSTATHPRKRRGTISLGEMVGMHVIHGPLRAEAGTYDAWTEVVDCWCASRTVAGNLAVYRRWAPVYDRLFDWVFAASRRRALELLDLRAGERVVLPGVGAGLDLHWLRAACPRPVLT